MKNMQLAYLEKERAYSSNSGVMYIDLPSKEQISMIMVEYQQTSGASGSVDGEHSVLDTITDISVLLEGSKIAYKAAPELGSFMSFLAEGKVPPHKLSTRGTALMRLPIFFGRYPGDEKYMLDTSKYSSAQLQIEYNLSTTYGSTGTSILTVWFLRPLESVALEGFIRNRVVNIYSSTGSAETKSVDLPTGLPWLRAGFRIYDYNQFLHKNVTDVDLDIDEGRLHLFNGRIEDLITLQKMWYGAEIPMCHSRQMALNGDYAPSFCGIESFVNFFDESANVVVCGSSANYGPSFEVRWTGVTTEETLSTQVVGALPFSGLVLLDAVDAPFDAPAHADAKITFELGAYTALVETFVQEVVTGEL